MTEPQDPYRMLFVYTGNSCRSQMAEGWARAIFGQRVEAHSAGTSPHGLNPLAVRAMREAGIDISQHASNHLDDFDGRTFDLAVTVCHSAHEACVIPPCTVRTTHRSFDDPPRLAAHAASENEAMLHYRRVRDEIKQFIESLSSMIDSPSPMGTHPTKEHS